MRIFSKGTLRLFWEKHPDSRISLGSWYELVEQKEYKNPHDVILDFPSTDQVGNGRIVFNIAHNKYRLIAKFQYTIQAVFVRFIGTHKEYDQIEDIKNI
ncbi:MAG: type II toxin-antitoxin system HigB family toxin [Bacteroidetes bacterium]|nr:type II toxin-antitoxin system HigB family toxin [Bacteroidota bacterium]